MVAHAYICVLGKGTEDQESKASFGNTARLHEILSQKTKGYYINGAAIAHMLNCCFISLVGKEKFLLQGSKRSRAAQPQQPTSAA